MRHFIRFCFGIALLAAAMSTPQSAQAQSISSLRADALSSLLKGEPDDAVIAADKMVKAYPDDTRAMRLAGDIYLRSGKPLWSTRMFKRYLEEQPKKRPELWQNGIALYFTGDYKEAAAQFEVHREVNPHDVENAAWHFLCIAKAKSFATAKKKLLPAPDDSRVPMEEVLQMLKTGDTDAVEKAVNKTKVDSDERESAVFYGDFYLGLYADARGDSEKAKKYMRRAAEDAPRNYMGDIARVYAKHLEDRLEL